MEETPNGVATRTLRDLARQRPELIVFVLLVALFLYVHVRTADRLGHTLDRLTEAIYRLPHELRGNAAVAPDEPFDG